MRGKHRYWINNGRVNELWQSQYHDEHNSELSQKAPIAILEMNQEDCAKEGFKSGDIVELFNEFGSAHAMVRSDVSIKSGQTFMVFVHYNGNVGNLVTPWTDQNMLPWYKGTWATVKLVSRHTNLAENISFKARGYPK